MQKQVLTAISEEEKLADLCPLMGCPSWLALEQHFEHQRFVQMRHMFESDDDRADKFSESAGEIFLDYSKNRVTEKTMFLLMELARERGLEGWRENLFGGKEVNSTEHRAVLHTALRNRSGDPVMVAGEDVMPLVLHELKKMRSFTDKVRSGSWKGYTGKRITDVVNIGIGGSDLGPAMACEALRPYKHPDLTFHFVSNVDGTHIKEALNGLDSETTLFIIASKTFTTQETLRNGHTARNWFLGNGANEADISHHFVAISTNEPAILEFGIDAANMFCIWDWVGGRYSMWSSVGLSIALSIGMDGFEEMLQGAYEMDQHFIDTPIEHNIPVILAMLGVWYINFFGSGAHALLPYDQYLARFPDYFQQAGMESNGKSVDRQGHKVDYRTGPVIWGQAGTNGQHAFYQLIHQGRILIPADFFIAVESHNPIDNHHDILISNYFAQTEALMKGRTAEEAEAILRSQNKTEAEIDELLPFIVFDGNKPTNSLMYRKLTPKTLGSLVAMYEHKIFVQGVIWNVNSYDQWGVELGKQLARGILPEIHSSEEINRHDASTNALINRYRKMVSETS